MKVEIELHRKAKGKTSGLYLVKADDVIVGMLEKYNNTRTESHPWKAFKGVGLDQEFIGSFYPEEGGKLAALAAVIDGKNGAGHD